MAQSNRDQRLMAELESLRALKKVSSIFEFEFTGEPPDRYTLTFRGKGLRRDPSPHAEVEQIEIHRCDLRLPYSFPERSPDVRWLTPLFHPNVSFSGFLNLKDVGLDWEHDMGLDIVCERLWDVARLAHLDLEHATNYSAKNWFDKGHDLTLPLDSRPLRDQAAPSGTNIVKYRRRGQPGPLFPASEAEDARRPPATVAATLAEESYGPADGGDVLFIGDVSPPVRRKTSRAAPPSRMPPVISPNQQDEGDDILYIGE